VQLGQVTRDRWFLDMVGYRSLGATTGILDDDGFQCPRIGHPCVSGLGLDLDLASFSLAFLRAMLPLLAAHFPIGHPLTDPADGDLSEGAGTGTLAAPASLAVMREEQETLYQRFRSQAAEAVARVGLHLPPDASLLVSAFAFSHAPRLTSSSLSYIPAFRAAPQPHCHTTATHQCTSPSAAGTPAFCKLAQPLLFHGMRVACHAHNDAPAERGAGVRSTAARAGRGRNRSGGAGVDGRQVECVLHRKGARSLTSSLPRSLPASAWQRCRTRASFDLCHPFIAAMLLLRMQRACSRILPRTRCQAGARECCGLCA
jgi:hypothetical protein